LNYTTVLLNLPLVSEAKGDKVSTPQEALEICSDLAFIAQESFHVLTLTTKNRLINRHMVSLGTVNSTPVSIPECFRCAILDAATSIVVAHGHPSGDATPGTEDIGVTRRLIEAGAIVGIRVLDHIIIGRDSDTGKPVQVSLREQGICQFKQ